jgi:hypothetical protein
MTSTPACASAWAAASGAAVGEFVERVQLLECGIDRMSDRMSDRDYRLPA